MAKREMTRGHLGFLMLLSVATPAAAADVEQTATGWCKPVLSSNNNAVTCNDLDPRTIARLNEDLDRMDLSLKQKTAEANNWAQKYHEVDAELGAGSAARGQTGRGTRDL
jgi:hypothetical protein